MTRDEAIGTLMGMGRSTTLDDLFVDRLVALGLLKLDEPKGDDLIDALIALAVRVGDGNGVILSANNAHVVARYLREKGFQLTKGPISRYTYAEDLYRDALERVARAVEQSYIVMHTEAGERTETVYGFIRRTLASVSK